MMTSPNGDIFRVTGYLCGEFTCHRCGEFPAQNPVTRSFDVFFDRGLNKRMSKQRWGWWFDTPSHPLWRHNNGTAIDDLVMPRTQCGSEVMQTARASAAMPTFTRDNPVSATEVFNVLDIFQSCVMIIHDFMGGFSGFGLSQWATTLHCNVVSHWLSPYPLYVHEVHISCVCGRRVPRVWHPILGGRAAVCDGWFCCCAGNKFGVGRKVGERTHRRPWAIPGLQKDALVHAAINGYCRKGVCS